MKLSTNSNNKNDGKIETNKQKAKKKLKKK